MTEIQERLRKIQEKLNFTQTELANMFGVSFPAFNAWFLGKTLPRPKALNKIDNLYNKYTGKGEVSSIELEKVYDGISDLSQQFQDPLNLVLQRKDLYEHFCVRSTYHSDAIEGSTLTERETAMVIFENTNLKNKTLVEQIEAKNHNAAIQYMFDFLVSKKDLDERYIKRLHEILMNGIIDNAGNYRNHSVRIAGTNVVTANYLKVPELIGVLINEIKEAKKLNNRDYIKKSSEIHARFEKVHPFSDGNGRVGRLLLNTMLLAHKISPAIIESEKKILYYTYLEQAQEHSNYSHLELFIAEAIIVGYQNLK